MDMRTDDITPFLGQIVDIIPRNSSEMLITMTVDDITEYGIICRYWERYYFSKGLNRYVYDDGSDDITNPARLEISNIVSIIPTKIGFTNIEYALDTDLGV